MKSVAYWPQHERSTIMRYLDAQPTYRWLSTEQGGGRPTNPSNGKGVIFVLGAGSRGPVKEAARLFHNLKSLGNPPPKIAFCSLGGNFGGNLTFGLPETLKYLSFLLEAEIHESSIIFPAPSRWTSNTLAEAIEAREFITGVLPEAKWVVLISRPVHQRRAMATFKKQWPEMKFISWPCGEELTVELLPRMLGEINRIIEYGEKEDLVPQKIPKYVIRFKEKARLLLESMGK